MKRNTTRKTVFLIIITVLLSLTITSCGAILYDLIEGSGKGSGEKYSLTVSVTYTGYYSVYSTSPIYIAVFGYYFNGSEPDLVYVSVPIVSTSGSYTFNDLDEMSYGVLVFLDQNYDGEPSTGDVYEFYFNKEYDPDEIYMNYDNSLAMTFDDTWIWVDGFYENFDDGMADNWIDDGSGRWYVTTGTYTMQGNLSNDYAYSYYYQDFDDFTYGVSIKQNAGDHFSERGIIFRTSNPWDLNSINFEGYLLKIDGNRNWKLEKYVSGMTPTALDSGTSTQLNQGIGGNNIIEVTCIGSTISIYFNGNYIKDVTDNSYLYGKVGIFGYDDGSLSVPNEFWFDDANLY